MKNKLTQHLIRGQFLVMAIPWFFGLFALSLFIFDMGQQQQISSRAQTVSEAVLLSSLRIRVESLQTIAERWENYGRYFGEVFSQGDVFLTSGLGREVERQADQLRRSLPGYKGRITAVRRIVAEANGLNFSSMQLKRDAAQDLGVVPERITVRDETGRRQSILGGWFRREWGLNNRLASPSELSELKIHVSVPLLGQQMTPHQTPWVVEKSAVAKLLWDVNTENPFVQTNGNGGYPRHKTEALHENRLRPHRWAFFSALITEDENEDR